MTRLESEAKFAKLRPERAKYYPGIDREAWFPVLKVSDLGVRVDLGSGHGKRELFMFWQDVDAREIIAAEEVVHVMDDSLEGRWSMLVELVRAQCHLARGQDPNVLLADRDGLKLSLPLPDDAQFSAVFSKEMLLSQDPTSLASDFFAGYDRARSDATG